MRRLLGVLLIYLICAADIAAAKPVVRWVVTMEPPITYESDGLYQGYGIDILNLIQNQLTEYDHKIQVTGNYKRLAIEVEKGPLSCAIGLFKTEERLKNMYFSYVPVFYFFNMQMVLRKEMFVLFDQPGNISLNQMLSKEQYVLGLSRGRTYFKKLRGILDRHEGNSNIYIGSQGNVAESLLHMLMIKRIDYMFLYPEEAVYLSQKLGYGNKIVTVPIQEASELGYSWAASTKSEEGKILISKLSKALIKIRKTNAYRAYYERWLSENLIPSYRKQYDNTFLKIYEK